MKFKRGIKVLCNCIIIAFYNKKLPGGKLVAPNLPPQATVHIYCLKLLSNFPNFVIPGSHGRPDSRGPLSDDPHQQPHSMALRAASIGLLNGGLNSAAVGPRIRQLQQQLSINASTSQQVQQFNAAAPQQQLSINGSTTAVTTTRLPASSLASVTSNDGMFVPRGSLV
jgi:hypothetical protein